MKSTINIAGAREQDYRASTATACLSCPVSHLTIVIRCPCSLFQIRCSSNLRPACHTDVPGTIPAWVPFVPPTGVPNAYSQFVLLCSTEYAPTWKIITYYCVLVPHHVPTQTRGMTVVLTAEHPTRTLTGTLWGDQCLDAVACEGSTGVRRLIRPTWMLCLGGLWVDSVRELMQHCSCRSLRRYGISITYSR